MPNWPTQDPDPIDHAHFALSSPSLDLTPSTMLKKFIIILSWSESGFSGEVPFHPSKVIQIHIGFQLFSSATVWAQLVSTHKLTCPYTGTTDFVFFFLIRSEFLKLSLPSSHCQFFFSIDFSFPKHAIHSILPKSHISYVCTGSLSRLLFNCSRFTTTQDSDRVGKSSVHFIFIQKKI